MIIGEQDRFLMVEFLERLSVLLSVKLYHLDDIESV